MDKHRLQEEYNRDAGLRDTLKRIEPPVVPSREHDAQILSAALETSEVIRKRTAKRASWHMPLYLAASFLLGVAVVPIFNATHTPAEPQLSGLVVPLAPQVRSTATARTAPVEEVPAAVWYGYIQELIYSGDAQLAARHLQRFVELHPDYIHKP